jgi:hypothetical protein
VVVSDEIEVAKEQVPASNNQQKSSQIQIPNNVNKANGGASMQDKDVSYADKLRTPPQTPPKQTTTTRQTEQRVRQNTTDRMKQDTYNSTCGRNTLPNEHRCIHPEIQTKIKIVQTAGEEVKIHKLPEDKICNLLAEIIGGTKAAAKITKISNGIIVKLNNSSKVTTLLKELRKGPKRVRLPHLIELELTEMITTKTLVVKGIRVALTNSDILNDIVEENPDIKVSNASRVISREGIKTTVISITIEGETIPREIFLDGLNRRTEAFLPPIIQCENCQNFCHRKSSCRKDTRCRFCAGPHTYDKCPEAKKDKNYKVHNPARRCANCGGDHGARFQGCPEYQKTKAWLKESLEKNIPLREIKRIHTWHNVDVTTKIKKVTKEVAILKKTLTKSHEQNQTENIEEAGTRESTSIDLENIYQVQKETQENLQKITTLKLETENLLKTITEFRESYVSIANQEANILRMGQMNSEVRNIIMDILPFIIEKIQEKMGSTPLCGKL